MSGSGLDQQKMQPVFIIAPPKTGSTLLTRVLCQHPDFTSIREGYAPEPWHESCVAVIGSDKAEAHGFTYAECDRWQSMLSVVGRESPQRTRSKSENRFSDRAVSAFRDAMTEMLKAMASRTGASVAADSWPFYGGYMDLVSRAFPEALYVCAVRDPRAVAHATDTLNRDVDISVRLHNLTATDRAAWPFFKHGKCFVVQYERLVRDPSVVRQVWGFVGLDPSKGWLERDPARDPYPMRWNWIENAASEMDPSRTDRWQREMPDSKIRAVNGYPGVSEYCKRWGYDRDWMLSPSGRLLRWLRGAPMDCFDLGGGEGEIRAEVANMSRTMDELSSGMHELWEAHGEPYAHAFHDPESTEADVARAESAMSTSTMLQQIENWMRWRAVS